MTDPGKTFTSMVPGFDFLQGLVKNAGAAMPGVGQWIAPTLDPEELDKRINDLKTVQFWLEQNARVLATTIQALEVQRMTLSTLKTMNVSFGDLTEALKIRMPGEALQAEAPVPAPPPPPPPPPAPAPVAAEAPAADAPQGPAVPPGVIDPMQWWGALTQQFGQIAASAMQDGATDSARNLAGQLVQQGLDAASATFRQAAAMPAAVAQQAASVAAGAAAKSLGRLGGTLPADGQAAASAPRKASAKSARKPAAKPAAKPRAPARGAKAR
jgi:hypothetical protein